MHIIETGTFLGRVPFARNDNGRNPVLVINGGQGFMMTPDGTRLTKDIRRLKRLLPTDRSFVLVGYDPSPVTVTVEGSRGWRMTLRTLSIDTSVGERMWSASPMVVLSPLTSRRGTPKKLKD